MRRDARARATVLPGRLMGNFDAHFLDWGHEMAERFLAWQ